MRQINKIIIHCTATKEGQFVDVAEVTKWHKARGFNTIGYHYLIGLNGEIWTGRPLEQAGAHTEGYNANSIGICYVGGLDANSKPKDTRTRFQRRSFRHLSTRPDTSLHSSRLPTRRHRIGPVHRLRHNSTRSQTTQQKLHRNRTK